MSPSNPRLTRAFTLVELLVVITIIGVLVALLMPSFAKAKESTRDVRCAANMRGTLAAVMAYGTDFKYGLKNLNPGTPGGNDACPYYEVKDLWYNNMGALADWQQGPEGVAHFALMTGWNIGYGFSGHGWDEARNLRSHWRGYLIRGKYAEAAGLGCNATDYSGVPLNGWSGQMPNIMEPIATQKSLLKTPPYQWWGPGVMSWYQSSVYSAGNFYGLPTRMDGVPMPYDNASGYNAWGSSFLLMCPSVNLGVSPYTPGTKRFVAPHRSQLGWDEAGDTFGPAIEQPSNLGYIDGSVKWVHNKGGWVNYNSFH
jgi:prepilin-type N-terminal cleavage/methylation domain-containing protein